MSDLVKGGDGDRVNAGEVQLPRGLGTDALTDEERRLLEEKVSRGELIEVDMRSYAEVHAGVDERISIMTPEQFREYERELLDEAELWGEG